MLCVPNPLTGDATYLVVANRRLFMKPDGGQPQLLGYDLEKLPWAYPDYVVFNTDQSELPFVLNVNDKPPVTCYEAAYYVEAGFFDADWRVDRALELRRVIRQRPNCTASCTSPRCPLTPPPTRLRPWCALPTPRARRRRARA